MIAIASHLLACTADVSAGVPLTAEPAPALPLV